MPVAVGGFVGLYFVSIVGFDSRPTRGWIAWVAIVSAISAIRAWRAWPVDKLG